MMKMSLRTNKTRAAERPPLLVRRATPALLARLFPNWVKPKKQKQAAASPQKNTPPAPVKNAPARNGSNPFASTRFSTPYSPAAGAPRTNGPPKNGSGGPAKAQPPAQNPPKAGSEPPRREHQHGLTRDQKPKHSEEPQAQQQAAPAPVEPPAPKPKPLPAEEKPNNPPPEPRPRETPPVERGFPRADTPARSSMDKLFRESLELFGPSSAARPVAEPKPPVGPQQELPARSVPVEPEQETPPAPQPKQPIARPSFSGKPDLVAALKHVFARFQDLPPQSAVLGLSDDGLPVLLDLFDPTPGALLVMGDERDAQIDLLRSILASTAERNTPRSVQFLILSHQPETWKAWISQHNYNRYCLAIEGLDEETTRTWTLRLADWTEQRRLGQRSGPPVLLLMDSLSFLQKLDYDVRLNFDWMAKEGPAAQIWPIAAVSVDLVESFGSRMLRGFASRVIGFARDPQKVVRLSGLGEEDAVRFTERGRFAVHVGETWLSFRLVDQPSP